ncbi:MAG: SDR family oxidoreductase [Sandaracinaceae bacterium]|nr:SDR family oxidoreductase [Sandaracinaceae bacterium]
MDGAKQDVAGMLKGKVAIVTGGSTGIGEATSKLFAKQGANVVVNGLPGDPVDAVVGEILDAGGIAVAAICDVGTVVGAERCVTTALESFGQLDILVANAGVFPELAEIQDFPLERFNELMHTNVEGVYLTTRAAIPELHKTNGCIVALGSEVGLVGFAQGASYSATKGWVTAFIRSLAAEQAKYGVRANVVAPGPIDTEMTRPSKGTMGVVDAFMAVKGTALGRRGTPEEVANVIMFLASDLASFVTGAIYTVDGGSTASQGLPGFEAGRDAKRVPKGTVDLKHQHEGRGTLR